MRMLLTALGLLLSLTATAAEPESVAIHSRHVLDVKSGTASDAYVVVRGDRIAAIAHSAPAGARVVERGAAPVLPGLIDCHAHVDADWNALPAVEPFRRSAADKT